jgi:hypothetical protein
MKKFVLLIPVLFLFGCGPSHIDTFATGIVRAENGSYGGGSCFYEISCIDKKCMNSDRDFYTTVKDSCNKFKIGDTIKLFAVSTSKDTTKGN